MKIYRVERTFRMEEKSNGGGFTNIGFDEDDQTASSNSTKVHIDDNNTKTDDKNDALQSSKVDTIDNKSNAEEEDEKDRQQWDSSLEFLLSCISLSVGLGNIWRFPTTAFANGGGAFLIPYFIVLIFVGRPMYFTELSLGQFSSCSMVKVWKMVPAAKGIGYGQFAVSFFVVSYYTSIVGIAIFYLLMSFSTVLPWSVCNEEWADERCIEISPDGNTNGTSAMNVTNPQVSAEQYFKKFLMNTPDNLDNGPGTPDWRLVLCLAGTWFIIVGSLLKGVKSSGKVAYFTALFPYVGLITLLIKGCTLPGAADGILYFITPQWEKLLEPSVWFAAVGQSFFSLSVAFGSLVMFSSHNNFRQNIYRDATIISMTDTFTSLLGGCTIFSCLGYLKHVTGAENFEDVVSGGTTLVFVTYPSALATFGGASQVFSVLFFLMLITLGIGSSTPLVSTGTVLLSDKFPGVPKRVMTLLVSMAGFLVGLTFTTPGGQWILDIVDFFAGTLLVYVLAIVEIVSLSWIFGYKRYLKDMRFMLGIKLGFYWQFCAMFFIPIGLIVVLLYLFINFEYPTYDGIESGLQFPVEIKVIGWLLFVIPAAVLPLCYAYEIYKVKSSSSFGQRALTPFKASDKYGPRLREDRKLWEAYTSEKTWKRLDAWKALSKEAMKSQEKMIVFDNLYKNAQSSCHDWTAFEPRKRSALIQKLPFVGK